MTRQQRVLIAELGPYRFADNGCVLDNNGIALMQNSNVIPCAWDLALVALLNEITEEERATPRPIVKR